MIKNKRLMSFLFILILIGSIHQIKFSQTPVKEIPELMSSMRAKEFCSCFYLLGKGRDYCLNSVKKGYPLFEFKIDEANQSVSFKNSFASARAFVLNKKYGCHLE